MECRFLYRYVEFAQGAVQRGLQVGRGLAFADDQGTGHVVFAGGKLFFTGTRDHDGTGRYVSLVFDRFLTGDGDDFSRSSDNGVGAENHLSFQMGSFDHDAAGTDETVVFDDDRGGLYRAVRVTTVMDDTGYWSRLELARPDFVV